MEIEQLKATFLNTQPILEVQTSGSTGVPKIIQLPKKYMEASAKMTLGFLNLKEGDRALLCMSPHHIGGIMMVVRAMLGNLILEVVEPTARPLKELTGDFDFVAMVPYQVEASLEDLPHIKKLIIGGGPISPELEGKLRDFPNEIYHTYGMTETISHIAMRRVNGEDCDWFKTMPGVRLSCDERGCLVIDAPQIGVESLVTNDLVELQDKQIFKWLGRADNVVNSAGLKLHPETIEKKIGAVGYPYFLAGIPDKKLGESLVMIVEAEEKLGLEHFTDSFENLGKYEVPKKVFCTPHFAMTESGKLNRNETLRLLNLR